MKKGIIGLVAAVVIIFGGFKMFGSRNSFELNVVKAQVSNNEAGEAVAQGVISKGSINLNDVVKIKRNGTIVKNVRVEEIDSVDGKGNNIKSASKGDNIYIVFEGISDQDLAVGDEIVK